MTLRDQLNAETDPQVRTRLRAEAVRDLAALDWDRDGGISVSRNVNGVPHTLVFERRPELVRNRDGRVVGVECWVSLYRNGRKLDIDGHRRLINPPVLVPDGGFETVVDEATGEERQRPTYELNVREALLVALVESIRGKPR